LQVENLTHNFNLFSCDVIVLASHYETNYPLKDVNFVGANDGACTSALLIALGQYFGTHPPEGYSVWLVFDDGEEAIANPPYNPAQWSTSNSLYGTRHLAAKWYSDGTLKRIKAFIVADMIGDKDLNILEEMGSTPWLRDVLRQAARNTNHTANVFQSQGEEEDDHLPFLKRGVPSLDVIDADYGAHTNACPTATTIPTRTLSTRSAPNPFKFPPTSSSKPFASSTSANLFADLYAVVTDAVSVRSLLAQDADSPSCLLSRILSKFTWPKVRCVELGENPVLRALVNCLGSPCVKIVESDAEDDPTTRCPHCTRMPDTASRRVSGEDHN
jgi:hypothetical protein